MTEIKVKRIGDNSLVLRIDPKGDWIDLFAAKDTTIRGPRVQSKSRVVKLNTAFIPLGVAIELPKGFEAIVNPRSSTEKNYGVMLVNSQGVIDNSYRGNNDEWMFQALALRDTTIPAGSKIAQFRIQPNQHASWITKLKWLFSSGVNIKYVLNLSGKDRGGFGTTGK